MKNRLLIWPLGFGMVWMFGITILRGLQRPNDWAEAHWLIGYQFGFLKRALPGTLLGPFITDTNAERLIAVVSSAWLGLFFLTLLWICFRILRKSGLDSGNILAILTFLTSPYIVMSAFLNGYYDNLLVLFTVTGILLVTKGRNTIAALVLTMGILVHENIFLVGFPSVLLASVIYQAQMDGEFRWQTFTRQILPFLIPFLIFFALFFYQSFYLDGDKLRSQLTSHLAQFEFVGRDRSIRVPDAFTISFLDYTERQSQFFLARIFNRNYLIRVVPNLIAILLYAGNSMRNFSGKKLVMVLLTITSLIPLSLHLIARDTSRIWTFPLIAAFLGLWTIFENGRLISQPANLPVSSTIFFGMVIINNLFIETPLMGGMSERYSSGMRFWFYIPAFILVLTASALIHKYSEPKQTD